ncbi:MAG: PAS domain S-box protein, partial [Pseudomonadota bacterium]|nr:PAS domain S-box protein [Pseudomonadota bacterium]
MRIKPRDDQAPHESPLPWWYWIGSALILLLLGLIVATWRGGSQAIASWAAQLLFATAALAAVMWVSCGVALQRAAQRYAQLAPNIDRVEEQGQPITRGTRQEMTEQDASVARLLQAQEIAAIGEWLWDVDAGQMTWSEQIYRIYGLDPATFTPDPVNAFECIHPDDREAVREYGRKLAELGEPCRSEFRIVRPDGEVRVIDARGSREPDTGARVLVRSIQQDITEFALIRDGLQAAQKDYRFMFEHHPLPMWVFDRATLEFLAVNDAMAHHYGYEPGEILGKSMLDIRPVADREAVQDAARLRSVDRPQGKVWTHLRKDGARIRAAVFTHDIEFEGRQARLVAAQDVTEREASEQRFQLVARATSDVVWDWDIRSGELWWSDSYYSTFGYDRIDVPPTLQGWEDHLHPDDRARVSASLEAAIEDPASSEWKAQYRYMHGDGRALEIIDRGFILRDADGRATRAVGGMLDITETRRAESEMRLLQRTVESAINGICIVDMRKHDQPIVYVNPAFEQMTGYRADEVIGHNCRFLQGPARDEAAIDKIREALRTEQPVQVLLKNFRKDRTPFWNELLLSPVRDDAGALSHYVGVQNDVSERYRLESRLAYASSHDTLTGLANRAELRQHLERLIANGDLAQHSAALLFIDLDNFKLINDSLGHETGDAALKEVARRLRGATRSSDLVARFGGDEFVALLQARGEGALNLAAVIERIQSEFQAPVLLDGKAHYITASIGYVRLPEDDVSAEQLLIHADLAMYKAKQMGRNRAVEYSPGFGVGISDRLNLISQIGEGLRLEQFVLHYQPIMQADGEAIGVEALVRWQHPERGLLAPAAFIEECETSGLIVPLGRWVMREAARCARTLIDMGLTSQTLRMSVNVSALQFQNSLVDDVT